jgi:hypothetical protein
MAVGRIETTIVMFPILAVMVLAGWAINSVRLENVENNNAARSAGFADSADMAAAQRAGLTDVGAWRSKQEQDKQNEIAERAAQASRKAADGAEREKREAERQAEKAAYEAARPIREALAARKAKEDYESSHITRPQLTIISWEKGGFGSVALMTVKITNTSDKGYVKDIAIACEYHGKSGTTINSHSAVIYETIKPKQSYIAKGLNMGFINQQAANASCSFVGASAASGMIID